jgi:predicted dehydrogenase
MSKLRLIQCGAGGMGKAWWNGVVNTSPDFDLVAMVDVVEAPLHEAGDKLNLPRERRFSSLESALDRVEADAVLTVTPPVIHVQHAELAFRPRPAPAHRKAHRPRPARREAHG